MYIVKVLKRMDAAAIILAIVLAFLILTPLRLITEYWTNDYLVDSEVTTSYLTSVNADWKQIYLQPLAALAIQLILVEIGLRLAIYLRAGLVRRVK